MNKKQNAEEDYITTPISVLSYITDLEKQLAEARESHRLAEESVQYWLGKYCELIKEKGK